MQFPGNNKLNKGFTLVETLVAISIFSLSILGLMSVLASGVSSTSFAKNKIIAGYLAQEGVEYARNTRDTYVLYNGTDSQTGWDNFKNANNESITPPPPSDVNFTRTIQKTIINDNEVRISSRVNWAQGSGNYNITFVEYLFNWIE